MKVFIVGELEAADIEGIGPAVVLTGSIEEVRRAGGLLYEEVELGTLARDAAEGALHRSMLIAELERTVTRLQLDVLRRMQSLPREIRISDLARELELPLNATHNRVKTLLARGFVISVGLQPQRIRLSDQGWMVLALLAGGGS